MTDLIERQAAIDAIEELPNCRNGYSDTYDKARIIGVLEELPSAQPDLQQTCNKLATDCISRQAAIDAADSIINRDTSGNNDVVKAMTAWKEHIKGLPSAQSERIIYANMSDEEFEKWLYEHGICNPNIHESIPCSAVPLLIDNAISELPSAQPEPQWIPCSERLPKPFEFCLWTTTDGRVVYHHCDGMFSEYTAWMPLPEPYKGES